MFMCVCNALNQDDVQAAKAAGVCQPSDLFAFYGCDKQCGKCVETLTQELRPIAANQFAKPLIQRRKKSAGIAS